MIKISHILKIIFFILVLVCNWQNIFAQNQSQIVIYGYVLDSNNNPLSNANVIDTKTRNGAYTNIDGYFSFKTKNNKTIIKISHIGYKSFSYNYKKSSKDSLNIVVYLNVRYSVLAPVEISSKNTDIVYSKPNYYIYDFAFNKSNVLLLINHKKKNKLLYIDEDNDTLSILNTNKGIGLIKDCLGNIHVISKDSIYQLYIDEDDFIYSVYSYHFNSYVTQLTPCAASFDSLLLFVKYSKNNQSEIYYYYDSNHKHHVFRKITDESKYNRALIEEYRIKAITEKLKLEEKRFGSSGKMAESKPSLEKGRELFQRKALYKFILTTPIYNPTLKINDSLFLFDHVNKRCYVYDNFLILSRFFDIDYCTEKDWAKKLFIDNVTNKVYTKFEKNGKISLKEINLINGSLLKEYKLNDCIFPLKIGVNNGYVYFLQNEIYGDYKTKLYKQRLN